MPPVLADDVFKEHCRAIAEIAAPALELPVDVCYQGAVEFGDKIRAAGGDPSLLELLAGITLRSGTRTHADTPIATLVAQVLTRQQDLSPSEPPLKDDDSDLFPVPPVDERPDETAWPRLGASYTASWSNPDSRRHFGSFASALRDLGQTFTRLCAIDAWAIGEREGDGFKPGQYTGSLPVKRVGDGRFDLAQFDKRHYDLIRKATLHMNARGIVVQWDVFDLYSWSDRKAPLLWVPNTDLQPMRNNINGVRWGDDQTFDILPDEFLEQHTRLLVEVTQDLAVVYSTGNEMPEKRLHQALAAIIRSIRPDAVVSVNRQDDTPGQYVNMRVGQGVFDLIAYHGKRALEYLDEDYPDEPTFRTFRAWWSHGDYAPARVIFSTDGCRASTDVGRAYDYGELLEVCRDHRRRGFSVEHQLACKLRPFTHGRFELSDLAFDAPFLAALAE